MATIDKAAIGFSIAIVAVGVAFAMFGQATQDSTPTPTPTPVENPPPVIQDELVLHDKEMKTDKEMKMDKEMKTDKEMKALSIKFGPESEMIEITTDYELTNEDSECSDDEFGVSGHCVPYYIKGGTITDVSVNTDDNAVAITIDAMDEGYLTLFKSEDGIDAIRLILVDGEETDDYYVMDKSEMKKHKDKEHDDKDKKYDDKDRHDEKKTENTMTGPQTITVDMPEGTQHVGCQVDNACYIPADVTINTGDTVSWINSDTAAHTVTSGSPSDGPTGIFDSSLVMAGASFDHTFEEAGTFEYFCIVHPWMVGTVTVN